MVAAVGNRIAQIAKFDRFEQELVWAIGNLRMRHDVMKRAMPLMLCAASPDEAGKNIKFEILYCRAWRFGSDR